MPYHVARLLTPPSSPLSSILQAAASQAWSRRAYLNRTRTIATKVTSKVSKVNVKATPASFTRATPHLLFANDAQDHSSQSTNEIPSKSPTPKLANVPSLCLHSPYDEPVVDDICEIIPKRTPKICGSFKRCARPIEHKLLSSHDFDWRDPGRVAEVDWLNPPPAIGTPVCPHSETLPQLKLTRPTSPNDVYNNLLLLTCNGPFTIRQVINYYFECPESMHSTKSFNLLISLALRNASFGGVGRLLKAMETEDIPRNMETWKLHVRWLVRTDRWTEAWQLASSCTERKHASTTRPNDPMPLDLWLELLGSQKRGALRHWIIGKRAPVMDDMESGISTDPESPRECIPSHAETSWNNSAKVASGCGWEALASLESHDQADCGARQLNNVVAVEPLPSQIHHGFEKQLAPQPWQRSPAVEQSRYKVLMQVSPLRQVSRDTKVSPRTILIITRAMYLVGQSSLALSAALSYLASLPLRLRRSERRAALDLVHLHLAMVTRRGKPGLKQHFAQRRMLRKFLDARPNLQPTSMTLFLLLGPLRGCRRGGTLAMQCLRLFEKRWGSRRVQSKLVRRRVAKLALKEGRLDIVRAVIKSQRKANWELFRHEYPQVVSPKRRIAWRETFGRRGVWNRRWRMIEEKYYFRSKQAQ